MTSVFLTCLYSAAVGQVRGTVGANSSTRYVPAASNPERGQTIQLDVAVFIGPGVVAVLF